MKTLNINVINQPRVLLLQWNRNHEGAKPVILVSTILSFRVLGPSQSVWQSWAMVPWSYCFGSSLGSQNSWVVSVIALTLGVSDPSVLRVIAMSWRCWKPQPLLFQILSSQNSVVAIRFCSSFSLWPFAFHGLVLLNVCSTASALYLLLSRYLVSPQSQVPTASAPIHSLVLSGTSEASGPGDCGCCSRSQFSLLYLW